MEILRQNIKEHKAWTDDNGITHPGTGTSGRLARKAAAGLTEVTPETPPDSRLYHWGYEADGVTISKTAKSLTDVGVVDDDGNPVNDDDGNQIMEPGVRSQLKAEVKKAQQGSCFHRLIGLWFEGRQGNAIPLKHPDLARCNPHQSNCNGKRN